MASEPKTLTELIVAMVDSGCEVQFFNPSQHNSVVCHVQKDVAGNRFSSHAAVSIPEHDRCRLDLIAEACRRLWQRVEDSAKDVQAEQTELPKNNVSP